MIRLPRISIRVDGSMTPAECVELAKAAEDAGLTGIWFAENAFERGILPSASSCALATTRIRINAGVFNPYTRHPTMMAMEIGALDELSGGRAGISIGAGIMTATVKMGLDPAKPVPALRDTLAIVRKLLSGQEVDYEGSTFSAKRIALGYQARRDIPIYLAGRGNLTVKLSGESADGLIVSNMCSVDFAGRVAELMRSSRRNCGRGADGEVVQYMPASVRPDRAEALRSGKRAVGEMLPRFWALGDKLDSAREAMLAGTAISEAEFSAAAARLRGGEDPAEILDDRYATAFALAGTADDCLALAERYKAAGVTELALTFTGPEAKTGIAALGAALAGYQS